MSALLAVLLLLVSLSPAWAAIAHVQTTGCSANGVASCTTPSITSTTGNLFVASSGLYDGTFTSVSDSKSNTYTLAGTASGLGATNIVNSRVDYKANGAGGASHTFTLTTGGNYSGLAISEVSGAAAAPLDQTKGANASGVTSCSTGSTATTSQANELLYGTAFNFQTPIVFTTDTGAGWVERWNITPTCCVMGVLIGTRGVTATGTYAYTYTISPAADCVAYITTWKEAAAAGVRQRCVGCGADGKVIE